MNSFGMKDEIDVACELMLTEKDHRKNISKFIDDESLVDMLHNIDDKKSMWLAKNVQNNSFDTELTVGGEFDANKVKGYLGTTDFKDKFTKIGHWLTAMNKAGNQKSLNDYSFADAYHASHEWHEDQANNEYDVPTDGKWSPNENAVPIGEHGDYIWYDLKSTSCKLDGDQMGHCGTTTQADTILSLRQKSDLKPVVSMSVTKTSEGYGSYTQCKGKVNTVPPSETHEALTDFIITNDMEHTPEYGFESEFSSYMLDNKLFNKIKDSKWVQSEIESVLKMRPSYIAAHSVKQFLDSGVIDAKDVNDETLVYLKELNECGEFTTNINKAIRNNITYVGNIKIKEYDETITMFKNGEFKNLNILGNFDCSYCKSLTSLEGVPQKIGGHFVCCGCTSLTSLKGAPQTVVGNFDCISCRSLTSLEGAPQKVGGRFVCSDCTSLTSLEGAPQTVVGNFDCSVCKSLTSLKGAPQKVGGRFVCSNCKSLTSLEGAPQTVVGNFVCRGCESLTSLKGAPQKVGGSFVCYGCNSLTSLEGAPPEHMDAVKYQVGAKIQENNKMLEYVNQLNIL